MADSPLDDDLGALQVRVERGSRALPELPPPDPARIGDALADIPPALGVGFVSPLFTALAVWPDWFRVAWERTSPRIGGDAWDSATRAVRSTAREIVSAAEGDIAVDPELAAYLALLDGLLPRLLVVARAWGDADGSTPPAPGGGRRPEIDSTRAPHGTVSAEAEAALQDLAAAHGHPRVLSVYRALAAGGPLFAAEAPALIARAADPAHAAARARLRAAAVAPGLAAGVPTPPDGAADVLALFGARLIPDLILDVEWLRRRAGLEGSTV